MLSNKNCKTQSVTHTFIVTNIVAYFKNSTGKLATVARASNLSTWQVELEGQLHSKFKVILDPMSLSKSPKIKNKIKHIEKVCCLPLFCLSNFL